MEQQPSTGIFQGASPKLTFIFGLMTGIGATALVALILFVTMGYTPSKKSANANTNTAAADTGDAQTFTDVAKVSSNDYVRGDKNAKVTLIEYSDLECPYCKTFHPVTKKVLDEYDGKVNFVYRHFPLSFHANAQKESEAALCVGKLGGDDKYFSFIDKVFDRTTSNGYGFSLDNLPALAKEVGVSESKFKDCYDSGEMASRVSEETNDGSQGGASGTPTTFVVNAETGKTITGIPGAYTFDQVKSIIDSALNQV